MKSNNKKYLSQLKQLAENSAETMLSVFLERGGKLSKKDGLVPIRDIAVNYPIVSSIAHINLKERGTISKVNDNRWKININRDDTENRQRFSIAHELGHLYLIENSTSEDHDWFKRDNIILHCRYGESTEVFCEAFAAALLVPRYHLNRSLKTLSVDFYSKGAKATSMAEYVFNGLIRDFQIDAKTIILQMQHYKSLNDYPFGFMMIYYGANLKSQKSSEAIAKWRTSSITALPSEYFIQPNVGVADIGLEEISGITPELLKGEKKAIMLDLKYQQRNNHYRNSLIKVKCTYQRIPWGKTSWVICYFDFFKDNKQLNLFDDDHE